MFFCDILVCFFSMPFIRREPRDVARNYIRLNGNGKFQRCSCGLWRCIKRYILLFYFIFSRNTRVREARRQPELTEKCIRETTKIIKSIIRPVLFQLYTSFGLGSFSSFLLLFMSCEYICTNTTNVRATDALFSTSLALPIFFIVFNLFCHLSSVVFSNATNEIQFGEKPFFSAINEIDFKHKK